MKAKYIKKILCIIFIVNATVGMANILNAKNIKQLVVVSNQLQNDNKVMIKTYEKVEGIWKNNQIFLGTIGGKGFASFGNKIEGDVKTPSGFFPLKLVFGYAHSLKIKMPYRQATSKSYWIDDPTSKNYNQWVNGNAKAKSYEFLKRNDGLYEYSIVIGYNMNPIVPDKGSAIFMHVWKDENSSTLGCVSLSRTNIMQVIKWLDIQNNPYILMGNQKYIKRMIKKLKLRLNSKD